MYIAIWRGIFTINYYPRIVDENLALKLKVFGATNIEGPKWCGKTTTALNMAKSSIMFQKYNRESLIETARINPYALLEGEKPLLIDEWPDAPQIWDSVRSYCDENPGQGHFILTGSTAKKVVTAHTGTGRISKLKMYPMSLYESKESNGQVSLRDLFTGNVRLEKGCKSDLTINQLIFAACRGGWPNSLLIPNTSDQLYVAKDYFRQILDADMFKVDNVRRNKKIMRSILRSYARNISTLAKTTSILCDISPKSDISANTVSNYISVLEDLFVVEELKGWCPAIRSSSAMRSGSKREFVDPSIAVAALNASPDIYKTDLKSFGFIFECLCIRDLRVYSSALGGEFSYYHDRYGLEVDVVLHLDDGKYALIEIKLGAHDIEDGAKHLLKVESLIREHNRTETQCPIRPPDLKIVLTGTEYGYLRPDGVYVIPIGCLKD